MWILLTLLLSPPSPPPQLISLVELKAEDLAALERAQRQSESPPLRLEDLEQLAAAGVGEETLMEMMRTRKVLALADAQTLIRLKKAGASDRSLAALSAYAVKPNEGFHLRVNLKLTSPAGLGKLPQLYIEVRHADLGRQEAFLSADLKGQGARTYTDDSDPLLSARVREVILHAPIKTRHPGRLSLRVALSQAPGLQALEGLGATARLKAFSLDYPAVSLARDCVLDLTAARDPILDDLYEITSGRLDCRWD
ncbi:hypothetical protein KKB55_03995 [Myxococcota bacterium]|nr:hypothetical protein [Myxococcota bacterium]MBU1896912.1 hypothetical protein [Myxococcota bacterium]